MGYALHNPRHCRRCSSKYQSFRVSCYQANLLASWVIRNLVEGRSTLQYPAIQTVKDMKARPCKKCFIEGLEALRCLRRKKIVIMSQA